MTTVSTGNKVFEHLSASLLLRFSLKTTTLYRVLLPPCGNSDKLPNNETSKATLCDAIA